MRKTILVVLALFILAAPASTQDVSGRSWTPPFEVQTYDLPISSNGVGYRLFIREPLVEPREGERPITVYVLDALWNLPAVAALHSNVEFLRKMPPIVFVGVGYQNENEGFRREANRTRDYTPTAFRPSDPEAHFLRPVDYEGSGGAQAFLDVMKDEVIPFVERRFDVDPDTRGLVGKSMGGLLATYALLAEPDLFSHYLVISPALWWDDYFRDFRDRAVMRIERETRSAGPTRPVNAYFTMGDGEERLGMLADVYVLSRALRLREDPNLGLVVRIMDGEDHEGSFARGFGSGIRHLFEKR